MHSYGYFMLIKWLIQNLPLFIILMSVNGTDTDRNLLRKRPVWAGGDANIVTAHVILILEARPPLNPPKD